MSVASIAESKNYETDSYWLKEFTSSDNGEKITCQTGKFIGESEISMKAMDPTAQDRKGNSV